MKIFSKTILAAMMVAALSAPVYANGDDAGNNGGGNGGCGVGQTTNGCGGDDTGGGGDDPAYNMNYQPYNENNNRNVFNPENTNQQAQGQLQGQLQGQAQGQVLNNTNDLSNTNTQTLRNVGNSESTSKANALGVGLGVGIGGKGGNASVRGSGNSENNNTNTSKSTAFGGVNVNSNKVSGGKASATAGSVNNNVAITNTRPANTTSTNKIKYSGSYKVKNTPSMGVASIQPSAGCRKPLTGAYSGPGIGLSIGTTFLDETCVFYEDVRHGKASGDPVAMEMADELMRRRLQSRLDEQDEKAAKEQAAGRRGSTAYAPAGSDDTDEQDGWANYQALMGG